MSETNPNYVPVDWGGVAGAEAALGFGDLVDTEAIGQHLDNATFNSAGDPIKVGDRVHHLADVGIEKRSVGVVTYVGPVTILGGIVDNGARCRWDRSTKEESHHVDQLTVLHN